MFISCFGIIYARVAVGHEIVASLASAAVTSRYIDADLLTVVLLLGTFIDICK